MCYAIDAINHYDDPIGNTLKLMTKQVREVNEANGWHDHSRTVGDGLMLIVSEAAEALDAFRDGGTADQTKPLFDSYSGQQSDKMPKPEGYGSEMADILIRLLDECDRQNVNLAYEFTRKLAYNRTRGYHHGGRKL